MHDAILVVGNGDHIIDVWMVSVEKQLSPTLSVNVALSANMSF